MKNKKYYRFCRPPRKGYIINYIIVFIWLPQKYYKMFCKPFEECDYTRLLATHSAIYIVHIMPNLAIPKRKFLAVKFILKTVMLIVKFIYIKSLILNTFMYKKIETFLIFKGKYIWICLYYNWLKRLKNINKDNSLLSLQAHTFKF